MLKYKKKGGVAMSSFIIAKLNASDLNNGDEYIDENVLTASDFNKVVGGVLYNSSLITIDSNGAISINGTPIPEIFEIGTTTTQITSSADIAKLKRSVFVKRGSKVYSRSYESYNDNLATIKYTSTPTISSSSITCNTLTFTRDGNKYVVSHTTSEFTNGTSPILT